MQENYINMDFINSNIVNMIEGMRSANFKSIDDAIRFFTSVKHIAEVFNPGSPIEQQISNVLNILGQYQDEAE